jgi:hypothetical protein
MATQTTDPPNATAASCLAFARPVTRLCRARWCLPSFVAATKGRADGIDGGRLTKFMFTILERMFFYFANEVPPSLLLDVASIPHLLCSKSLNASRGDPATGYACVIWARRSAAGDLEHGIPATLSKLHPSCGSVAPDDRRRYRTPDLRRGRTMPSLLDRGYQGRVQSTYSPSCDHRTSIQ